MEITKPECSHPIHFEKKWKWKKWNVHIIIVSHTNLKTKSFHFAYSIGLVHICEYHKWRMCCFWIVSTMVWPLHNCNCEGSICLDHMYEHRKWRMCPFWIVLTNICQLQHLGLSIFNWFGQHLWISKMKNVSGLNGFD